jgi:D-beta-D-heptose 7-phosphate kinase/D-beta-D-heptose 1-phosphate adenosyltransferase
MSIIVIGDIMLDINYNSEVRRNAPEAEIPIYNILDVNYKLGGAANVANNLNNLYKNILLLSVIGNDEYGQKIHSLLNTKSINNKLFIDYERKTTQKHRIFLNNKLHVRYDIEDINDISNILENKIIDFITKQSHIAAIVISDYDKGFITEKLCQTVISYCNLNNIPTFIDPKLKNYMKYKNCFLFKPNQSEAEIISGEKNIDKILDIIKTKIKCKNILLTRGKEGMILNNSYNKIQHDSFIDLVDVTGAGDIVISVLVYIYLKNKDLFEATKIANYIAGKSVGVIGNYCILESDIDDFYQLYKKIDNKIIYDHEIDKIDIISKKNNIVFTNGCFDILHSAHIELLKFSKNQGDILVVGLNSDESVRRLKGNSRPINDIYERSKILSLFDFVDYIIVFNDDTPLNIIMLLKPDILVKGSDYNMDNIVGKEVVKNIKFFNLIDNKSSTLIINKIKNI